MREYTYSDLMKMQEDAIERAREMQKRSQFVARQANKDMGIKCEDVNHKITEEKCEKKCPKENKVCNWADNANWVKDKKVENKPTLPQKTDFFATKPPPKKRPTGGQRRISLPVDYLHGDNKCNLTSQEKVHDFDFELDRCDKCEKGESKGLSIFKNLNVDNDQILLMTLFLLLKGEGADESILLALLYIMF